MKVGPVFTQCIAIGCLAFGNVLVLALPGDISTPKKTGGDNDVAAAGLSRPAAILKQASSSLRRLFRNNVQLGLLLFSLLFTMIGAHENNIRLQYSVKRYGFTWGEVRLNNTSFVPALPLFESI